MVGANKHGSRSLNEMFLSCCSHLAFWNSHFESEKGNVFTGLVLFQDYIPWLCLLVVLPGEHLLAALEILNGIVLRLWKTDKGSRNNLHMNFSL